MATFKDVLDNPDKKWKRKIWVEGGMDLGDLISQMTVGNISPLNVQADDWEEYIEKPKYKKVKAWCYRTSLNQFCGPFEKRPEDISRYDRLVFVQEIEIPEDMEWSFQE